jgi:hypothetical protein
MADASGSDKPRPMGLSSIRKESRTAKRMTHRFQRRALLPIGRRGAINIHVIWRFSMERNAMIKTVCTLNVCILVIIDAGPESMC